MSLLDYLSKTENPRVEGRCKHKLGDILVVAIATNLCGSQDYRDTHQLTQECRRAVLHELDRDKSSWGFGGARLEWTGLARLGHAEDKIYHKARVVQAQKHSTLYLEPDCRTG